MIASMRYWIGVVEGQGFLIEKRVTVWSGATINVLHNPTRAAFKHFSTRHPALRGLLSYDGTALYVWDAAAAVHPNIMQELGLDQVECIFFNRGRWSGPNLHDEQTGDYKPAIQRLTPYVRPISDQDLLAQLFADPLSDDPTDRNDQIRK